MEQQQAIYLTQLLYFVNGSNCILYTPEQWAQLLDQYVAFAAYTVHTHQVRAHMLISMIFGEMDWLKCFNENAYKIES